MRSILANFTGIIYMTCIFFGILGCSEKEVVEAAKIVNTEPADGGEMYDNESLVITFDKYVTQVKVNGNLAEVSGPRAIWKLQGIEVGRQTFKIEWIDEYENTGSKEITILVRNSSDIICMLISFIN